MVCPTCKQQVTDDSAYCMKCGSKIPRCQKCGAVIYMKARFCEMCGEKVPDDIVNMLEEKEANNTSTEISDSKELNSKDTDKRPVVIIGTEKVESDFKKRNLH